jgi:hypothetical protein
MVLFVFFFIGLSRSHNLTYVFGGLTRVDSLFFLITIFCSFYPLMLLIFLKKNLLFNI